LRKAILILFVLVLIVLGAIAGAPYWFGMQAETAYREMLEQATREGRLTLSANQYDRGWFSSTATATMTPAALPFSLVVTSTIHHGPFPMADGFPPDWTPLTAIIDNRIAVASAPTLPPLNARTRIDLDRQSSTRLDIPAHKLAREGGAITWQAIRGEVSGSADARRFQTNLQTPSLKIEGADGSATLSQLSFRGERRPAPSGLSLLDFVVVAANVGTKRGALESSLDGLKLSMNSEEKNGELTLKFGFEFRELRDAAKTYGPAHMVIRLGRLDSATLYRYQQQLSAAKRKAGGEPAPGAIGKTLELIAALAQKSPELELTRLSVKTPAGEVSGSGRLALDATGLDVTENPLLLLSALKGDAEIGLPAGVVRSLAERDIRRKLDQYKTRGDLSAAQAQQLTPEKTAEIVARAMPGAIRDVVQTLHLEADGDGYKARASLRQGRLLVNGQPIEKPLRLPAP